MKKKIIYLIPILIALFSLNNVHAIVEPIYTDNSSFTMDFTGYGGESFTTTLSANQTKNFPLTIWNWSAESKPYTYFMASVCSQAVVEDFYITNDGYEHYFTENSFLALYTGEECSIGSSKGILQYFQIQVGKWGCLEDGSCYEAVVSSYIHPKNRYSYSTQTRFLNFYMSSDDVLTQMRQDSFLRSSFNNISLGLNDIEQGLDGINTTLNTTNDKLDDLLDADAPASTVPNDDKYNDYDSAEGDLKDKVNQADLSNLSIGIDSKSSSWVWDTLTNIIQTNSVIFGMFIAILSIGVIKLALGR